VRGLDIGCGANLIYCLLGAATHGWTMVGTDVAEVALASAAAIREANPQLAPRLDIRGVPEVG
jgi:23S rRNA (adenine1618-N6)-methyltransferase